MADLSASCGTQYGTIGSLCGSKNDFRMVNMLLLTTPDFSIDNEASFAAIATYERAIKEGNMFVLKQVQEIDDQSEETKYYTAPSGNKTKTKDSVYGFLYKFILDLNIHKELQKFDGQDMAYYKVDSSGNIMGWKDESGLIRPFSISDFSTENMTVPLTGEEVAFSPLSITESNRNQWNTKGIFINPEWLVTGLKSLAPVEIFRLTSQDPDNVYEIFYNAGLNPDGTTNKIMVSGLLLADFKAIKTNGDIITLISVTESTTGVYEVTSPEDGVITLVDPSDLSEGLFIKAINESVLSAEGQQ